MRALLFMISLLLIGCRPDNNATHTRDITRNKHAATALTAKQKNKQPHSEQNETTQNIYIATHMLEDQMRCRDTPMPGHTLRLLQQQNLIEDTHKRFDGIPLFIPKVSLMVYGKRVTHLAGWQYEEDGTVKPPFTRDRGTAPPRHLALSFLEPPASLDYIPYQEENIHTPHSRVDSGTLDLSSEGSTITCFAS